uniref:Uncharacterized protein n=1 Tax=Lactuca sativa TaxID=4236 RepID=A0A9R1V4A6_LACSA|nr:hypothetical protein LSAT_V11C600328770 [Lactuca sativa]
MKLDVNCMSGGNNFFSKFYVFFDGLKKGLQNGCRKIIGQNGFSLKIFVKWSCYVLLEGMQIIRFILLHGQIGLTEVVKELLPYAEDRQCAKLIIQNLKKMFSGARYETIFLKDSKASTKEDFKVSMKYLEVLNPSAHKYLMDNDPKTWLRV